MGFYFMHIRLLVEKKPKFITHHNELNNLITALKLEKSISLTKVIIYDLFNFPTEFSENKQYKSIFIDPITDNQLNQLPNADFWVVIQPLSGQFDQKADSAEQCLQFIDKSFANTKITTAVAYGFHGQFSEKEQAEIKKYLINPIESCEKNLDLTELPKISKAKDVVIHNDFNNFNQEEIINFHKNQNLAMTIDDLLFVQQYFQKKHRNPTETEIKVLDTYWSDHCRHTTFNTQLKNITFPDNKLAKRMQKDLSDVISKAKKIYGENHQRGLSLMEIATIQAKHQRQIGELNDVEFSAEINACSVFVDVDNGANNPEKWLLQFKNETHNHPTEIEPYGGAATCIGGAIRDPLSGRAYVYQAMRISGSADPREPVSSTINGKLPQRLIGQLASEGASSYGNQIGLATGKIVEFYHSGYKAKHMELGAVVAAVPYENVYRDTPKAGDIVLLIGGATGRDGCGGATGSSKNQNQDSLQQSAAEVQKGNPPEERKLQRLFRDKSFTQKIKRCNDFGAGGVAVAIGELADGLTIDLDKVPVKYQGLSGTELAISESQERMAVVVDAKDVEFMVEKASKENLWATPVATICKEPILTMTWQGKTIVELDRDFLDTAGIKNTQNQVNIPDNNYQPKKFNQSGLDTLKQQLQQLDFADQRGLGDRFDHSVGASCVLLPFGGKNRTSPSPASVYLLPTDHSTSTASILSFGFNPEISNQSPYHGGILAVVEAVSRAVSVGANFEKLHFSLQEYFRKLKNPKDWGLALASVLGAHHALSKLNRAAIGGKDSVSGSFNDLNVPTSLIAFAVGVINADFVVSPEFKKANHHIYWLKCPIDNDNLPDFENFIANNHYLHKQIIDKKIASANPINKGGLLYAVYQSCLGNQIGAKINTNQNVNQTEYGGYLISSENTLPNQQNLEYLGVTTKEYLLDLNNQNEKINDLFNIANQTLADIYPYNPSHLDEKNISIPLLNRPVKSTIKKIGGFAKPRVLLPIFAGTNSELDTKRVFNDAGGLTEELVICNRFADEAVNSLKKLAQSIQNSQILVLSGGFSAGDEPDGSGKFIAQILQNPYVKDAIMEFLTKKGLILGICNGFQALIKSGLLPFGQFDYANSGITLTHNAIGRHFSRCLTTVISNNHSPWLRNFAVGEIHEMPCSHGEGRLMANDIGLQKLINDGQIACQYSDFDGKPSMHPDHNPNGSIMAIEALTSPCGQILGKMGHSERYRPFTHANLPQFRWQNLFEAGVSFFK